MILKIVIAFLYTLLISLILYLYMRNHNTETLKSDTIAAPFYSAHARSTFLYPAAVYIVNNSITSDKG